MAKQQAGKNPKNFITDRLPAYMKSSRKIFGNKTNHVRHIHLHGDMNNNKMERINNTIRDREKVLRCLKIIDTCILDGFRIHYNFTRKHLCLDGKTSAEQSRIQVDGVNKRKTIIQNTSLNKVSR